MNQAVAISHGRDRRTWSFILWGGDRWSQRTGRGIGKNIWLPLQWQGEEPLLKWYPAWNIDSALGTWTAEAHAPASPPAGSTPGAAQPAQAR